MKEFVQKIVNAICGVFQLLLPNKLFIYGFFVRSNGRLVANNWGDDINILFFNEYTDFNVLPITYTFLKLYKRMQPYLCIGSVLGQNEDPRTIVWGSGFISENDFLKIPPRKICSVRGPLTREKLLKQSISCPVRYGDPALLLPLFYKPVVNKRYEVGIVLHYVDEGNIIVKKILEMNPSALIINMRGYSDWHDVIDKINSCKKIISSSLHGIIVSDTYGIPNKWVRFSDNIFGGNYKFWDYFGSVGRKQIDPVYIKDVEEMINTLQSSDYQLAEKIDYESILDSCPFKDHFIL